MNIKTGYYNWNEFGVQDAFYPDDMPKEWRLSFYANELECVQLCLADFDESDDFEEIFDDILRSFSLVLKCDHLDQWPRLQFILDNHAENVELVLCTEQCYKQWSNHLWGYKVPCLQDAKQAVTFKTEVSATQITTDSLFIVYVDEQQTLKQWRVFIDSWVAKAEQENYLLLLDSNVYKSATASELRMIIDMMGY